MRSLHILILDDEKKITEQISNYLRKNNSITYTANTPSQAFGILRENPIDILITDIMLPEMNGLEVLKQARKNFPELEIIMISGHGDMDTVIDAMRYGAVDYLRKPFGPLDIQLAIKRTGKYLQLQNTLKETQDKLLKLENQNSLISRELENLIEKEFIGISKAIREVLDLALKAAQDKDISIMISGENGTGKEIVARIIHYASLRKDYPFYPVNSAAIPETLLESEFFGHIKGSFTGADKNKLGCFALANGGTLFLDEIADMPTNLQSKLLRVLEEKKIKQIGSNKETKVDVRIISATNRNIDELLREGKFRLDLYHRINTFQIEIPPLRERTEDIQPLVQHFTRYFARKKGLRIPKVDPEVTKRMTQYGFPGNVRELKNMVERAMILSKNNMITMQDFTLNLYSERPDSAAASFNLEQREIDIIKQALVHTEFNQTKAAKLLGISKDALFRRIKKYKLNIKKEIE